MRSSISPLSLMRQLAYNRHLLSQLVLRDVTGRYKGSFMGVAWSVINPVLMLLVYLFVFGVVFNARRGEAGSNLSEFGLALFCGILVHGLFSECLVRAPSAIVSQPSYVKKIVFPLEILPLVSVGSALFHYLIGLAVLLAFTSASGNPPAPPALLLPLILLPLLLMGTGVAWLFSALAVYLRDVGQLTGLLSTLLLFLSPVFYPVSAVPKDLQFLMKLNPLTVPIEASRGILLHGQAPDWEMLAWYALISLASCWLGFAFFQKTREGFADVL